jgi:Kef-type K+ transport system membrane component KefB
MIKHYIVPAVLAPLTLLLLYFIGYTGGLPSLNYSVVMLNACLASTAIGLIILILYWINRRHSRSITTYMTSLLFSDVIVMGYLTYPVKISEFLFSWVGVLFILMLGIACALLFVVIIPNACRLVSRQDKGSGSSKID